MDEEQPTYISYMLRLQRVRRWGRWIWRASLESPGTGKQVNLPDLPSLYAFLEAQTGSDGPERESDAGTEENGNLDV
jgi:hypothetical protein